jgi:UDP-N-acetylglucosamine--dolichyl-phosphate N-acetylglucosaminephosphotransferase
MLHLVQVTTNQEGQVVESSNLTILNLWLVWFGPRREDRLAKEIIGLQVACGLMGLFVRHRLALWIFRSDNLTL